MPTNPSSFVPWPEARTRIKTGDIALLRATGFFGRMIRRVGGCDLVHALMLGRLPALGYELFACEQVKPAGQLVHADLYFATVPSGIADVFRVRENFNYDGMAAWRWMVATAPGTPYPRSTIMRSFLSKFPYLRWHIRASTDDSGNGDHALVCSGMVARAVRAGGVDLVPRLSDAWTEPRDLYHSAALDFVFTIGG